MLHPARRARPQEEAFLAGTEPQKRCETMSLPKKAASFLEKILSLFR